MKIQTINELNAYFDPGIGHAKGRGKKIKNRSESIICTDDNINKIVHQEIRRLGVNADLNHLDVSQVTNMTRLFYCSSFKGDISEWDVSNVKTMSEMFNNSNFNGDISQWDVSGVENMRWMFAQSDFNQDISQWDVSNVKFMECMFYNSNFDQDVSKWKINQDAYTEQMFSNCAIRLAYKPHLPHESTNHK